MSFGKDCSLLVIASALFRRFSLRHLQLKGFLVESNEIAAYFRSVKNEFDKFIVEDKDHQ